MGWQKEPVDRRGKWGRYGEKRWAKDFTVLAFREEKHKEAHTATAGNYTPIICLEASAGIN